MNPARGILRCRNGSVRHIRRAVAVRKHACAAGSVRGYIRISHKKRSIRHQHRCTYAVKAGGISAGAGHLGGVVSHLEKIAADQETSDVSGIDFVPKKGIGSKIAVWLIPALIVALIAAGFVWGGKEAGTKGLAAWVIWNGALAGLGGLVFVVPTSTNFNATVSGYGFLAVAVLIFGQWKPKYILLAAFFFGFMKALSNSYASIPFLFELNIQSYIYKMVPYIATILVLIFTSKNSSAPKASGIPFDPMQR